MAEYVGEDLSGSRYERVDLRDSEFRSVHLGGARFRDVSFHHVLMRGTELLDVDIHGEIEGLRINGVDVGPLVEAELDRRYPERPAMRPTDAAGCRAAWDVV